MAREAKTKKEEKVIETEEEKEQKEEKTSSSRKKIKPKLSKEIKELLEKRRERYEKQPDFKRGEWFRYKKLGTMWRRPRAVTNKQRKNLRYRPPKVRIGFGKPSAVRNYHPSGFVEVLIHNVKDLEKIDPKLHAARIGATVGTRKRRAIVEAADSRGIRVLNRGVL